MVSTGRPVAVVVGDFDGDGIADLAVSSSEGGRLDLHAGKGNGEFKFPASLGVGGTPGVLAAGDLDGNGLTDIVWVDSVSGRLGLVYQNGPPASYDIRTLPGSDEPKWVAVIDVDGDSWNDVVTTNHGADSISVYFNDAGEMLRAREWGIGDGPTAFAAIPQADDSYRFAVVQRGALSNNVGLYTDQFASVQLFTDGKPAGLTTVDWNGDAFLDVVVADRDGSAHVYAGQPSGTFTSTATWALAPSASHVVSNIVDGKPTLAFLEPART